MSGFAKGISNTKSNNNNNNNNNNNKLTKYANFSGNKRAATEKTPEEKKKSRIAYLNSLGNFGSGGGYGKTIFVQAWKPSIIENFVPVIKDKILQAYNNVKVDGVEKPSNEAYLIICQAGYAKSLFGVGTRYVDPKKKPNEITPEFTEHKEYSLQGQFFFPTSVPEIVVKHNPNIIKELEAQAKFFEERTKKVLTFALNCEEMKPLKEECEAGAKTQVEAAKKKNPKMTEDALKTQKEVAFDSAFEGAFNIAVKTEKYEDENGKEHELKFIRTKIPTFRENYKREPPPADLKEYQSGNMKPQHDFIESAYENNRCLNRVKILNPDGTPREYGLFDIPLKSRSIVLAAVKVKWYDKSTTEKGCRFLCDTLQILWEPEQGDGPDTDAQVAMNGLHFIAGKPRTYFEIELLKELKDNVEKADGVSADELLDALVECNPPKMSKEELVPALETLMVDKFVVSGKEEGFFKLFNPDLDVDKLPSLPRSAGNGININMAALGGDHNGDSDNDDD